MKKWPKNEKEMPDYEDIVKPVRKAFKTFAPGINWKKASQKEHKWDGLEFGTSTAAICVQPDKKLTREGLDYTLDKGRDVLDELIHIIFCLGFEQGRRSYARDYGSFIEIANRFQDDIKKSSKVE